MSDQLQAVALDVQDHMDAILKHFKDGAKITVMVRFPGAPTQDFVMTGDDITEAAVALTDRAKRGSDL